MISVIAKHTNLPVGKINYKFCHELLGNIQQGISSHKDLDNGEVGTVPDEKPAKKESIGYLPIIILFNWFNEGFRVYSLFKDQSLVIPVYDNSVVVIVGVAAEQLYHASIISDFKELAFCWYCLSQLRIPNNAIDLKKLKEFSL